MKLSKETVWSFLCKMGDIFMNCIDSRLDCNEQSKAYITLCEFMSVGELLEIFCPTEGIAFYNTYCKIWSEYNQDPRMDLLTAKYDLINYLTSRTTPSVSYLLDSDDSIVAVEFVPEERSKTLNHFVKRIYLQFTNYIKNDFPPEPDIPDELEKIETLYKAGWILRIFSEDWGWTNITGCAREIRDRYMDSSVGYNKSLEEFKEAVSKEMTYEAIRILKGDEESEDIGDIEEDEL